MGWMDGVVSCESWGKVWVYWGEALIAEVRGGVLIGVVLEVVVCVRLCVSK